MSSLEDRRAAAKPAPFADRTEAAMASIEASNRKREAQGYALMAGFSNYGTASQGEGWFGRVSRAAKWFVIWFAMIVPVFLFWQVAF